MKKGIRIAAALSALLLLALLINDINRFNAERKKEGEVYFVFSQTAPEHLMKGLQNAGIPYVVDESGALSIQKKDETKAVACCT